MQCYWLRVTLQQDPVKDCNMVILDVSGQHRLSVEIWTMIIDQFIAGIEIEDTRRRLLTGIPASVEPIVEWEACKAMSLTCRLLCSCTLLLLFRDFTICMDYRKRDVRIPEVFSSPPTRRIGGELVICTESQYIRTAIQRLEFYAKTPSIAQLVKCATIRLTSSLWTFDRSCDEIYALDLFFEVAVLARNLSLISLDSAVLQKGHFASLASLEHTSTLKLANCRYTPGDVSFAIPARHLHVEMTDWAMPVDMDRICKNTIRYL